MEAVRGVELFLLLREATRLDPATAALYTAMAASALGHLHSLGAPPRPRPGPAARSPSTQAVAPTPSLAPRVAGWVHRDLKPENLILDTEGRLHALRLLTHQPRARRRAPEIRP